jgi:hypothetical protein
MERSILNNRVNCWNAKSLRYANQQPSRANSIEVTRKVQRLEIEELTNNISQAPDTLRGDDIVQAL